MCFHYIFSKYIENIFDAHTHTLLFAYLATCVRPSSFLPSFLTLLAENMLGPATFCAKTKQKTFLSVICQLWPAPQKLTAKGHGQQKQKSSSFPNAKKSKSDTNSFAMQKCLDYCS